jgi:hypothetical protein
MTPSQLLTIVGCVAFLKGFPRLAAILWLLVGFGGIGYLLGKQAVLKNLPWNIRTALSLSLDVNHARFYATHVPQMIASLLLILHRGPNTCG